MPSMKAALLQTALTGHHQVAQVHKHVANAAWRASSKTISRSAHLQGYQVQAKYLLQPTTYPLHCHRHHLHQ